MTTSSVRATPAQEAWSLIGRLMAERRGDMLALASEFELSPPQMFTLLHLRDGEPVPMREVAAHLRCDNSNVTGIVDRLEDRGFVARATAAHDRRVKHLTITAEGRAIADRVAERMGRPPAELDRLTREEQRHLRDLLRRAFAG